jgi:hypothetical protein
MTNGGGLVMGGGGVWVWEIVRMGDGRREVEARGCDWLAGKYG